MTHTDVASLSQHLESSAPASKTLPAAIARALAVSVIISIGAQLELRLPFTPVPITGQTLSVVLCGLTFGRASAIHGTLLYLAEGLAGLPVFSGGAAGIQHLTGPTAGYLVGFVPAAAIAGHIGQLGGRHSPLYTFAASLLSSLPIFVLGVLWLAVKLGSLNLAVTSGLLPFIPGDFVKAIVLSMILPGAVAVVASRRNRHK